jgi:Holliday junction resolvasome RuvABC endonuclease subunit
VKKLIAHYQPGTLVLEDASAKNSRRSPRIRTLAQQIVKMAATLKMTAKLFSRDQVMKTLIADGQGTKHLLAEIIAKRFPEQLGLQVPPKRKPWMSEDSRMGVFDAVALAMVFRQKYVKTVGRRRNWVQPVAALSAVGRHGRNARGVAEGAWGQAESQRVESRTIHLRSRVSGGGKEWRGKLGR